MMTRGGTYFLEGEGITANALLRKLREDAELCDADPRSLSGWSEDGAVGMAFHKPVNGWWSVVDSASGAPNIGEGAWGRVSMMANHLPTTAIWFRIYETCGIAVEFQGGGSFLRTVVGTPEQTGAFLRERGCPEAVAPAAAGKRVVVAALRYTEEDYEKGPDADAVVGLIALRDAMRGGSPDAVVPAFEAIPEALSRLALGVVRVLDDPESRTTLCALAEHFLARPMTPRGSPLSHITLEEEVMRRVTLFTEDETTFEACIERLDAVESEAYHRSSHAHPMGLERVAFHYFHTDKPKAADCYRRLALRKDPSYLHVNLALSALLEASTGELLIEGKTAELLRATEKRIPALGRDAKHMICYNLACAYARAGRTEQALTELERCGDPRVQNPKPEEDTDLASLVDHPRFKKLLEIAEPVLPALEELELSVSTSEALTALGLKTMDDLLAVEPSAFSPRQANEISELLRDEFDLTWGSTTPAPTWVPPAERAVPRLTITFEEGEESELVSRLGGRPNAPTSAFSWPKTANRPMDFVLQLVGKAAGGDIDLGDVHLIQVFADLEGEYYEDSENTVVIHREPCTALLECPLGVDEATVQVMRFAEGADDRILLDLEWPDEGDPRYDDHQAAFSHAFADKAWGIPTAGNLEAESVVDRHGKPMRCLLSLYSYSDWFLWFVFVDEKVEEGRMEIIR